MSRGPYPLLLMLAMSLPGAARALGLGEIRVDSALNEPLSAQIDIVGATRDDLIALTAKVANREIFQRFGAERPSFLSSATFKVGMDAQGRPVLNIRSAEAFTDPVVSFLVELRWASGALVRDYSLLLDPAGFFPASRAPITANGSAAAPISDTASTPRAVTAETPSPPHAMTTETPAAPRPVTADAAAQPATATERASERQPTDTAPTVAATRVTHLAAAGQPQGSRSNSPERIGHGAAGYHRVAVRDTLRAIARRAGARSETHAQRMMIAIFRANPHAFDRNINRLHSGALLNIPSADTVQALDTTEAKHEYRAHMTSWRLEGRPSVQPRLAANSVTSNPTTDAVHQPTQAAGMPSPTPPISSPAPATAVPATGLPMPGAPLEASQDALTGRVHSLEKEIDDMHRQLEQLSTRAATVAAVAAKAPAAASMPREAAPSQVSGPTAGPTIRAEPAREPGSMLATAAAAELPASDPIRVEVMRAPNQPIPATTEAANPAASVSAARSKFIVRGAVAGALMLLLGGAAFVRRRLLHSRSRAPQIPLAEDYARTPQAESSPSKPATVQAPVPHAAVAAARSIETAKLIAPEPTVATGDFVEHAVDERTTQSLAIDIEALERSYLEMGADSLGIDSVVEDTAAHDTMTLDPAMAETVVLHRSEAATAVHEVAPHAGASGAAAELDAADSTAEFAAPDVQAKGSKQREDALNGVVLDYDLLDLDASVQHVHMPSELNDRVVVTERRTNIVDVLKAAIDRDPQRRDLRMKLLETYYGNAAANQRAFLEVVRKASNERGFLSADDWQRVMMMGREIASSDALFADHPKDADLADCA